MSRNAVKPSVSRITQPRPIRWQDPKAAAPAARPEDGTEADLQLPAFSSLVSRKLVVPSTRTGHWAIDQFLFIDLISRRLLDVPVDEEWYLAKYPDVSAAIASSAVRSAGQHYARYGYFEHRLPWDVRVDQAWYVKAHPDVQDAIDKKMIGTPQEHFETHGFREGRLPYPGFSLFFRGTCG